MTKVIAMPESWPAGIQILQQDTFEGHLITSRPETVVQDNRDYLAPYTHPHAPYQSTILRDRYALTLAERYDRIRDISSWKFENRRSGDYHTLLLNPPDSGQSVWLMWDLNWNLKFWYVNFQEPIRRTTSGIVVEDLSLDIKIAPDKTWSWKDEDEFEYSIERGGFTQDQILAVRTEADRVVNTIEQWGSPFCDGWESWRADKKWPVPALPHDWKDLES